MVVHADNSQMNPPAGSTEQKIMIASTTMNSSTGFVLNVDTELYPTDTQKNNTFWVGDPHCVLDNCD